MPHAPLWLQGEDDVLACQRAAPSTVFVKDMYIQQSASETVDDDDDKTDIQGMPDPPAQMEGTTFSGKRYIYCQLDRLFMGKSTTHDRDLAIPYFYLFAVGLNPNTSVNATSPITMDQSNVLDVSPRKKRAVDYDNVTVVFPDLTLIKVHASFVLFTWLFLIPVGIMISAFFKIVWPNGGWFFVSYYTNLFLVPCETALWSLTFNSAVLTVCFNLISYIRHTLSSWSWHCSLQLEDS